MLEFKIDLLKAIDFERQGGDDSFIAEVLERVAKALREGEYENIFTTGGGTVEDEPDTVEQQLADDDYRAIEIEEGFGSK